MAEDGHQSYCDGSVEDAENGSYSSAIEEYLNEREELETTGVTLEKNKCQYKLLLVPGRQDEAQPTRIAVHPPEFDILSANAKISNSTGSGSSADLVQSRGESASSSTPGAFRVNPFSTAQTDEDENHEVDESPPSHHTTTDTEAVTGSTHDEENPAVDGAAVITATVVDEQLERLRWNEETQDALGQSTIQAEVVHVKRRRGILIAVTTVIVLLLVSAVVSGMRIALDDKAENSGSQLVLTNESNQATGCPDLKCRRLNAECRLWESQRQCCEGLECLHTYANYGVCQIPNNTIPFQTASCRGLTSECGSNEQQCCDGLTCQSSLGDVAPSFCLPLCGEVGGQCIENSDCCTGMVCQSSLCAPGPNYSECETECCTHLGNKCDLKEGSADQCCSELICQESLDGSGICLPPNYVVSETISYNLCRGSHGGCGSGERCCDGLVCQISPGNHRACLPPCGVAQDSCEIDGECCGSMACINGQCGQALNCDNSTDNDNAPNGNDIWGSFNFTNTAAGGCQALNGECFAALDVYEECCTGLECQETVAGFGVCIPTNSTIPSSNYQCFGTLNECNTGQDCCDGLSCIMSQGGRFCLPRCMKAADSCAFDGECCDGMRCTNGSCGVANTTVSTLGIDSMLEGKVGDSLDTDETCHSLNGECGQDNPTAQCCIGLVCEPTYGGFKVCLPPNSTVSSVDGVCGGTHTGCGSGEMCCDGLRCQRSPGDHLTCLPPCEPSGDSCSVDAECCEGLTCQNNICVSFNGTFADNVQCMSLNGECQPEDLEHNCCPGLSCYKSIGSFGVCLPPDSVIPSATHICKGTHGGCGAGESCCDGLICQSSPGGHRTCLPFCAPEDVYCDSDDDCCDRLTCYEQTCTQISNETSPSSTSISANTVCGDFASECDITSANQACCAGLSCEKTIGGYGVCLRPDIVIPSIERVCKGTHGGCGSGEACCNGLTCQWSPGNHRACLPLCGEESSVCAFNAECCKGFTCHDGQCESSDTEENSCKSLTYECDPTKSYIDCCSGLTCQKTIGNFSVCLGPSATIPHEEGVCKGTHGECGSDEACCSGLTCQWLSPGNPRACLPEQGQSGDQCLVDAECSEGLTCIDGTCGTSGNDSDTQDIPCGAQGPCLSLTSECDPKTPDKNCCSGLTCQTTIGDFGVCLQPNATIPHKEGICKGTHGGCGSGEACCDGLTCQWSPGNHRACLPEPGKSGDPCMVDAECSEGRTCVNGTCAKAGDDLETFTISNGRNSTCKLLTSECDPINSSKECCSGLSCQETVGGYSICLRPNATVAHQEGVCKGTHGGCGSGEACCNGLTCQWSPGNHRACLPEPGQSGDECEVGEECSEGLTCVNGTCGNSDNDSATFSDDKNTTCKPLTHECDPTKSKEDCCCSGLTCQETVGGYNICLRPNATIPHQERVCKDIHGGCGSGETCCAGLTCQWSPGNHRACLPEIGQSGDPCVIDAECLVDFTCLDGRCGVVGGAATLFSNSTCGNLTSECDQKNPIRNTCCDGLVCEETLGGFGVCLAPNATIPHVDGVCVGTHGGCGSGEACCEGLSCQWSPGRHRTCLPTA